MDKDNAKRARVGFECTSCGVCCRNISKIKELSEFDDGSGVCKHLHENRCLIYENHPEICRVDVMYEKFYSHLLSIQEFYALNLEACKKLKEIEEEKRNK